MCLTGIEWEDVDWINPAWDRHKSRLVVNKGINLGFR